MRAWRLFLSDGPLQAEEEEEEGWLSVWLSTGAEWGITLRIEFEIDADTFLDLALAPAGSRLLQELIETASAIELAGLQRICLQHALFLSKHCHANFVVVKLIQECPPWFCVELCRAFTGNVCELARHRSGSRVLERIIEHHGYCNVDFFFAELVAHAVRIVGHRYGNYVVQNLLENGPQSWRRHCLGLILKAAPQNGHAGRYFRCTLASAFERSTDEHILRLLAPLRPLFEMAECNTESMAAGCDSE